MSRKHFASREAVHSVRDVFASHPPNTPILSDTLCESTGLDLRAVRDAIAQLVHDGLPILSNRDHAYVLCTDRAVITRELQRLRSHATQIGLRADGLAGYLITSAITPAPVADGAEMTTAA